MIDQEELKEEISKNNSKSSSRRLYTLILNSLILGYQNKVKETIQIIKDNLELSYNYDEYTLPNIRKSCNKNNHKNINL